MSDPRTFPVSPGPSKSAESTDVNLWNARRNQSLLLSAFIMFAVTAGIASLQAHNAEAHKLDYLFSVGIPLLAALSFFALSTLFRDLFPYPRLKFPLSLTLPLVFCSLLPLISLLVLSPEKGIVTVNSAGRFASLWRLPAELALIFVANITALTVCVLIGTLRRTS